MKGVGRRGLARLAVSAVSVALAGCSFGTPEGGWRSSGVAVTSILPENGTAATLRLYLERLARIPAETAREALPRAFADAEETGSAEARLWAGLLAVRAGATGSADAARALSLAEGLAERREGGGWSGLVGLIRSALEGRLDAARALERAQEKTAAAEERVAAMRDRADQARRQLEEARAQQSAVREDGRSAAEGKLEEARKTIQSLRAELDEERKKAAALQGQLEQLKTIEKIMDRREEPKTKGSAP